MNKIFENKAFIIGFILGFISFLYITEEIDGQNKVLCFDCGMKTGFPFPYHQGSGYVGDGQILWFGLIADILIAVFFSFILGLIFKFVASKMAARNIELGKGFKVGVFLGTLVYLFVYAVNMLPKSKPLCFDCDLSSGFNFIDYQPGNSVIEGHTVWFGLIFNVLVGLIFVIISGLVFRFIWSKIAEK
jgi:hypothetical protein